MRDFRGFATLSGGPPPSLRRLYDWLVGPVRPYLKTPVVGIVPFGVLHELPFAALTDGRGYFGESYTLFSLPSASVLRHLHEKPESAPGPTLTVAASQVAGLPPLHYAEREARTVARLLGGDALLGDQATESAFRARASQAHIVHLAARTASSTAVHRCSHA